MKAQSERELTPTNMNRKAPLGAAGDTAPRSPPKLYIHGDRGLILPEQTPTRQLHAGRRSQLGHVKPKTRKAPSKASLEIIRHLWIRMQFPLEIALLKVRLRSPGATPGPSAGGEAQHEQIFASSRAFFLFPPREGLSALFCGSRKTLLHCGPAHCR